MAEPELRHGYATLDDVRLHYVEAGEGPLVLLLHGFPEHWYSWRHQLPALAAAGFRAVAPDLRGYGKSDRPKGVLAYAPERLAADVAGLIRALGAERAHVVGHDWGGVVAWLAAMWHPERVERLVILNAPHPARLLEGLKSPAQLARSWYALFFQLPWLPEAALRFGGFAAIRRVLRQDPARPGAFSEADVERYVQALSAPGALTGGINWYRAIARRSPGSLLRSLREVEAPTLVIWGGRDRYLGAELADPGPGRVTELRIERIDWASHWVQVDAVDEVNGLLVEFLAG